MHNIQRGLVYYCGILNLSCQRIVSGIKGDTSLGIFECISWLTKREDPTLHWEAILSSGPGFKEI